MNDSGLDSVMTKPSCELPWLVGMAMFSSQFWKEESDISTHFHVAIWKSVGWVFHTENHGKPLCDSND